MTESAVLPDAAPANWVDRFAPAPLRPWLKLGRFDRPTGIWLLMLPGWQGIALADALQGRWPDPTLLILFFLGATLMRTAGCAYNDIVDRKIDAQVARTAARPVASGQIGVGAAWLFVIACSLAGLAILVNLNIFAVALGFGSLVLVAIYPFMKRITWWPQAWLGLTFNWGVLMGYAAAFGGSSPAELISGGNLQVLPPPQNWAPLLLYASGVFWTLGYDTIYAVQDLEDDALIGVKSSARRLGAAAPRAVLGFYVAAILLAVAAAVLAHLGAATVPGLTIFAALLLTQPSGLKLGDPARALALFQRNTWAALALFAAMAMGGWRM
jgi:4-hydroxybenzoate polyprenyltransferase